MNDDVISLGIQLENAQVELGSFVGQLVKTYEYIDEDDIIGGHPRSFGFGIDIWDSSEFVLNLPYIVSNVIETIEQNVVCVVTNTFCNENSEHGGALEVITPNGTCGWVSVYDVIIAT